MYIDRNILEEYPFTGQFYTSSDNMPDDGDVLGSDDADSDAGTDTVSVVCEVECDIQNAANKIGNGTSGSYLNVYFPFDTAEGIAVRIGQRFRSTNWYRPVDGRVVSVVPSPMGGCEVQIKEIGVD